MGPTTFAVGLCGLGGWIRKLLVIIINWHHYSEELLTFTILISREEYLEQSLDAFRTVLDIIVPVEVRAEDCVLVEPTGSFTKVCFFSAAAPAGWFKIISVR